MEQQRKRLKGLKILAIVIISIILISIILTAGIGNYFVNYAILRSGDGGDRKVNNEEAIEVATIDDESERTIE